MEDHDNGRGEIVGKWASVRRSGAGAGKFPYAKGPLVVNVKSKRGAMQGLKGDPKKKTVEIESFP